MELNKVMNVIILYSSLTESSFLKKMLKYLKSFSNDNIYLLKNKNITKHILIKKKIHFLISFHNKYILRKNVLELLNYNCINFHSALLPRNRGADPILFSAAKNKVFGVTIHLVNEKIDDGQYLYQNKVNLSSNDNLKKAYHEHEKESITGFKKIYPSIKRDISLYGKINFKKIPKKLKAII